MTPRCGLLTLAAPPLTTNTTLPSSLRVTTELQRSYWVRDVDLVTRSCQSCSVGFEVVSLFSLPQSWAGVIHVMCGVSAASCLNTTRASHCTRSHVCLYTACWKNADFDLVYKVFICASVFTYRLMTIRSILL